ncbi:10035_t:CDS:2 [Entrophospora sp. SA101]|nr:9990_t:CDS:2 [Entrophospora sp. SA101]CAJ0745863.1 10035_t:CDS:2 [Entrophospora sp. SA101]
MKRKVLENEEGRRVVEEVEEVEVVEAEIAYCGKEVEVVDVDKDFL